MRKVTYDSEGNIIALYNVESEKEGILVEDSVAEKIMECPLRYKVVNDNLVETGYQPPKSSVPTEEERNTAKPSQADINELVVMLAREHGLIE